jgi:hypothetical protein
MKKLLTFWMIVGVMVLLLSPITDVSTSMILYLDDLTNTGVEVIIADGGGVGIVTEKGVTTLADSDGLENDFLSKSNHKPDLTQQNHLKAYCPSRFSLLSSGSCS